MNYESALSLFIERICVKNKERYMQNYADPNKTDEERKLYDNIHALREAVENNNKMCDETKKRVYDGYCITLIKEIESQLKEQGWE